MDLSLVEEYESFALCILDKFNPETMDFLTWHNYLEFSMDLVEVVHKNFYLLSMLDTLPITYVSSRVYPANPFELPYEMLISILEKKYSHHGVYYSTYFRLYFRNQIIGESVENYYKTIKKLTYKFNCGRQANSILLDKFVNGLRNSETRTMLQMIPNLSLGTALYIAKYTESVEKPFLYS